MLSFGRSLPYIMRKSENYPNFLFITAYEWKPQIWVQKNDTFSVSGPMATFLHYLTSNLNLSYQLIPPSEEESGAFNSGNWTGMMGMIVRNEANMSLTPLLITDKRFEYVSFSNTMFQGVIRILVGIPRKGTSLSGIITAFTPRVWLALGFIFTLVLFVKLLIRFALSEETSLRKVLGEQLWQVYSGLILKAITKLPRSISGRIITGFWMLLALVVVNMYCARMTSLLAVYKEKPFIKRLEDMANFPDVKPYLHKGSNEVDYFQKSYKGKAQREVYRRLRPSYVMHSDALYSDETLDEIENCQAVILQENRVFHVVLAERYARKASCRFRQTKSYRSIPVGIAFRKNINPEFLEDVNRRILYFVQADLMDYIYPPVIKIRVSRCFASNEEVKGQFNSLRVKEISTAILIATIGVVLSGLTFLLELFARFFCPIAI